MQLVTRGWIPAQVLLAIVSASARPALAQASGVTERASLGSSGTQGNDHSGLDRPAISASGRHVAFTSRASNLVPGDTNAGTPGLGADVFVRDRWTGTTTRVSVGTGGTEANGACGSPAISADGRYVAFESSATTLVPGDTNGAQDIFVHDRQTGVTTRVNVDSGGAEADEISSDPAISSDGRFVAFASRASNLVPGDTNQAFDVFLKDLQTGAIERVSVGAGGAQGDFRSGSPALSAESAGPAGPRYVAFESSATNLVAGDANDDTDVFVRDRQSGLTVRASVSTTGAEANGYCIAPSISADGRCVAFHTVATNLVQAGHTETVDILVRDLGAGTTERAGASSYGSNPNDPHPSLPSISADGRFVAFDTDYPFDPSDTIGSFDVYLRDLQTGAIERVSVSSSGAGANLPCNAPALSGDGRFVTFGAYASNLATGDTNNTSDTFLRDRDATSFASLCHPGLAGVASCPCSNPPASTGRGCDNSAATGGATLSATGVAYLSMDSLVFTSSGERPTAFSLVLQGNAVVASGLVYGQGVRCVAGSLKRLFTKSAVAGSFTAPDFGAGDPTVSARSAATGDPIQAGQTRWYVAAYRDPTVLGGCPATSTFNATQAGSVLWSL